jgi:peptide/nickel transport system substrate-binding protein
MIKMTTEKTLPKKKILKIKEIKKSLIIGGIIAVVAIAGIVSGIVILGLINKKRGDTLVIGVTGTLTTLDTIEGWSEDASSIITQVVTEGLFTLELINDKTRLIPNLATGYNWSVNKTELTCDLRRNVEFHDGTPFIASAVKWNIDRVHALVNHTIPGLAYLWQLQDGNWIINETKVLDDYTVKFVLNQPFVPLLSLLASVTSLMVSPSSTPDNEFINGTIPGTLSGTGAFIYSDYEEDDYAKLSPNPDYWGGRPAFDDVIIKLYPNDTVRYEAMLSGELSMTIGGYFLSNEDKDLFMNTTGIELEMTSGPYPGGWNIQMNNNLINATMRKAISYAFNFSAYATYLDLLYNVSSYLQIKTESPIPKRILYSHWGSFDMPYYNISIARQALKDANWPGTEDLTANNNITAGNEWEQLVTNGTQLATYNLTYPIGSVEVYLYDFLYENLKQIGVKLEPAVLSFPEIFGRVWEYDGNRNMLGIIRWYQAWGIDYNDPFIMINPLFSSKKAVGFWNFGQVNDTLVQQWMEEALEETNEDAREQLYFNIEKRLIEEVYPVIWGESLVHYDIHVTNLHWTPDLGVFTIKDWYFD